VEFKVLEHVVKPHMPQCLKLAIGCNPGSEHKTMCNARYRPEQVNAASSNTGGGPARVARVAGGGGGAGPKKQHGTNDWVFECECPY